MRILSHDNLKTKKRLYTVWLIDTKENRWKMYHCPDCRKEMLQYKGDIVMEVPGLYSGNCKVPKLIQCKNPNCGRKVLFQDVVSYDNI